MTTRDGMTLTERQQAAIESLRTHQQQLDTDGVMVGVSRQAIAEVLAIISRLQSLPSGPRCPECGREYAHVMSALGCRESPAQAGKGTV